MMKRSILILLPLLSLLAVDLSAQFVCTTWNDSPRKGEGEDAHSIYRQAMRSKDFDLAYEQWKIAYEIAPAADGKRDFHLMDGIALYKHKLKNTESEDKKKEFKEAIVRLYDECIQCYEQKIIQLNDCDDDCYAQKIGYISGRLGYDMYYTLNSPYSKNYEALQRALETNDVGAEYIVLEPIANIAVYQFQKEKETAENLRKLYSDIERIGDYNIENDPDYGEYYDTSKKRALSAFKTVEKEIFDCEYFKKKWLPVYENDPTNFEVMKQVVVTLKKRGCADTDPDLAKIKGEYERLAATYNAEVREKYERENPHIMAKKLYDAGDYNGAVAKYDEAISKASNPEKKAQYLFSKGSIEGRKLKSLSSAKASLKKAMELRTNWGRPYMLLGDLYAIKSRSCGDAWKSGLGVLAAIKMYSKAKNIDPSVSSEASSRIAKYQGSKPDGEQAFMQGMKAGQSVSVGCGIGETVSLSFR